MDLQQIVIDAQAGSRQATADLCEHLAGILERRARRLKQATSRPDFEETDLVQEAFVKLLRKLRQYSGHSVGELVSWSISILENAWRDTLRRNRRRMAGTVSLDEIPLVSGQPGLRSGTTSSPLDTEIMEREEHELLFVSILLLRDPDRTIVFARCQERLSFADIGRRMECSADAARMRYQRAIDEIARFWSGA